jgi:hypothetical protein
MFYLKKFLCWIVTNTTTTNATVESLCEMQFSMFCRPKTQRAVAYSEVIQYGSYTAIQVL